MASFMIALHFLLLLITCIFVSVNCCAKEQQKHGSFRPNAVVLPVRKDISAATNQYITTIYLRTPSKPTNLVLDLEGRLVWVFLPKDYASFTYSPVHCDSSQCALAEAEGCRNCSTVRPRPGCNPNTCYVITPYSRLTSTTTTGELAEDLISVQSTDGSNPGQVVSVPRLLFTGAPRWLKNHLTKHATGVAGLGFSRIGLPWQFASAFGFRRRFAICLPSSTTSDGVVFFGDSPYHFFLAQLSDGSSDVIDASQLLSYTPIFVNQRFPRQGEYFKRDYHAQYHVRLGSIRVNNNSIPLNTPLLSIDRNGDGGTIFSTLLPYTELDTSILNSLTTAFIAEAAAMNINRVPTVAPFPACFSSNSIQIDGTGPSVPSIDLVFQGKEGVVWTIAGANSMVRVNNKVMCLGFVQSRRYSSASIAIGAYQMENIVVQFDLENSRLGFSSNLLGRGTSCANFNFTSIN